MTSTLKTRGNRSKIWISKKDHIRKTIDQLNLYNEQADEAKKVTDAHQAATQELAENDNETWEMLAGEIENLEAQLN